MSDSADLKTAGDRNNQIIVTAENLVAFNRCMSCFLKWALPCLLRLCVIEDNSLTLL